MTQPVQSPTVPFSVACMGIATFAGMDVIMKSLSIEMGAYNAMLWRTSIALLIAAVLFFGRRGCWPEKAALRIHVWRGVVISLMAFLFFWGLARVPLAEMNRYSTALSSLTSGRASYEMTYAEYAQVPSDIQDKLLKAYDEQSEED